jgi:hypothetical protein
VFLITQQKEVNLGHKNNERRTIMGITTTTTTTTADEPTVPQIDGVMGGLTLPTWLQEEVEFKLSGSFLDKCIGLGLLARLWAPSSSPEREEYIQRVLSGNSPVGMAREFWRTLPEQDRRCTVRSGLLRCDDLLDDLHTLRHWVAADPVAAAPLALDWLRRRDDLEALLFLVCGTSDALVLAGALQTLDDHAAAEHSIWFFLPPFDDERLRAVARVAPDSWWGDLAVR